jgi:hypothetical protein
VDVITFGTPWAGFNAPFAYAFDYLTTLVYLWPFTAVDVIEAVQQEEPQLSVPVAGGRVGSGARGKVGQLSSSPQSICRGHKERGRAKPGQAKHTSEIQIPNPPSLPFPALFP